MPSPLFPRWNRSQSNSGEQSSNVPGIGQSATRRTIRSAITSAVKKKINDVGSLITTLFGSSKGQVDKLVMQQVEEELKRIGSLIDHGESVPARPPMSIGGRQVEDDDWKQLPENKPVLEGMFEVSSSNVHSIGYLHASTHSGPGDLLVRFLGVSGKERVGPGALYRYRDVPESVWDSFKNSSSYGRAVWTDLRVLGSIAGHQYAYDLEETGNLTSVPRQSAVKRGQSGEFFVKRTLGNRRSSLPERQVRGPRGTLPGYNRPRTSRPTNDHRNNHVKFYDSNGNLRRG